MTTNHVRDCLLPMDTTVRQALRRAAVTAVNASVSTDDAVKRALGELFFAVYVEIVDLEQDEKDLLRNLENDL